MAPINATKVFNELTAEINLLLDSKPGYDGLHEKIAQLFRNHGLKPNKKGIGKIVKDYVKRTGAES